MKRLIIAGSLLIITICGYSQEYKPLVKEDNNWSVVSGGFGQLSIVCCVQNNRYKFMGDTTIGTTNYKKLVSSTSLSNQNWKLVALIRENISSKKVWLRNLTNQLTVEYLTTPSEYSMTIFDIHGKQLIYKLLDKNTVSVDISNLTNGVYLITVSDNHSKTIVITDKLIINK